MITHHTKPSLSILFWTPCIICALKWQNIQFNDDAMEKDLRSGKITLGGCCIADYDPKWQGADCQMEIHMSTWNNQKTAERTPKKTVVQRWAGEKPAKQVIRECVAAFVSRDKNKIFSPKNIQVSIREPLVAKLCLTALIKHQDIIIQEEKTFTGGLRKVSIGYSIQRQTRKTKKWYIVKIKQQALSREHYNNVTKSIKTRYNERYKWGTNARPWQILRLEYDSESFLQMNTLALWGLRPKADLYKP